MRIKNSHKISLRVKHGSYTNMCKTCGCEGSLRSQQIFTMKIPVIGCSVSRFEKANGEATLHCNSKVSLKVNRDVSLPK